MYSPAGFENLVLEMETCPLFFPVKMTTKNTKFERTFLQMELSQELR